MARSSQQLPPQPVPQLRPSPLQFFRQARTRILLLYILLMLLLTGLAIPLFRILLERQVTLRVRADLVEAKENFLDAYAIWEQSPNQTAADLQRFADQFLSNQLPADDNFLILIIDGQLYRSNPLQLPPPVQPKTPLFRQWLGVTESGRGEWRTANPTIGTILYKVEPLFLQAEQQGVFVVAHTTAGEQGEVLASVSVFGQVATGVLIASFILAWLGTGKLLAPVRHLARTTRLISESDLSQRLPVQGSGELADLIQTFNAMMDRLQGAFDSQRRFVNDAGHELRTPITIVRGHLELMGYDPQEQQETVALVLDELDRMGRLVNDMIALAKSERPDFLRYENIDLSHFVSELFSKAQALAERNWQLSIHCSGSMLGDRQQLTGALLNLLRNATQHTQPRDTIELGCRQTPTQVQFWVKDTGSGIAPHDQQRIFERFARVTDRQSDGSGLGLAIASAITKAHHGSIELISQPGLGSTFTLKLPRSPDWVLL